VERGEVVMVGGWLSNATNLFGSRTFSIRGDRDFDACHGVSLRARNLGSESVVAYPQQPLRSWAMLPEFEPGRPGTSKNF